MLERAKTILGLLSVLIGFSYSYHWSLHSMNEEEFVLVDSLLARSYRGIAAVKKDLGLGAYTDHLIISTSPLKSLSLAKLTKTENFFQITLGHFSTKDKRGELAFACQVYDRVTLTYESHEGSEKENSKSVPQTMVLEMSCKIAENDVKHLMPINLAPAQILKQPPGDGTYQFSEKGEFSVRFQNVEDKWAKQWVLKSVQFKDSQNQLPTKEISVLELPAENRQSLNMDWSRIN